MRYLSRTTLVVCVAVLLFALPVQATQPQRTQSTVSAAQTISDLLNSLWAEISQLLLPGSQRSVKGHGTPNKGGATRPQTLQGEIGSCIDPDGCPVT